MYSLKCRDIQPVPPVFSSLSSAVYQLMKLPHVPHSTQEGFPTFAGTRLLTMFDGFHIETMGDVVQLPHLLTIWPLIAL